MIKVEDKANRIVRDILVGMGLVWIFLFWVGFGMGFAEGLLEL
jgi:hypothetical protein